MTTTPFIDNRKTSKDNRYPLYVRISDGKKQKLVPVGYKIEEKHWETDKVKKSHPLASVINAKISDIIHNVNVTIASSELLGRKAHFELLGTGKRSPSFIQYIMNTAIEFEKSGKVITSIKFYQLSKMLKEIFGELTFEELSPQVVKRIDQYYTEVGNKASTKQKKMQFLSMIVEMAKNENVYGDRNWFKDFKIKSTPTSKVKLSSEEIAKLETMELTGLQDLSRDIFLFSFYCKGMRFGDCLMARREDISDGRIQIVDQKTGKPSSHKIHDRLKKIIDKYEGYYIFPLVEKKKMDKHEYIAVKGSMNALVNKYLKQVAKKAGITKHLSMHIARHSFANQLKELGINSWVIMESLNHSSIQTTQNYLKELNKSYLDEELTKLYGV